MVKLRWHVDFEPQVAKQIKDQANAGLLTAEDFALLRKWIIEIEENGLTAVQAAKWNDHPLAAEWTGYRSASFSSSGRVIYRAKEGRLLVTIVRVTSTHNYRK